MAIGAKTTVSQGQKYSPETYKNNEFLKSSKKRRGAEYYGKITEPHIMEDIKKPEKKWEATRATREKIKKETKKKIKKELEVEESPPRIIPKKTESEADLLEKAEMKKHQKSMIFLMPEGIIIMSIAFFLDFGISPIGSIPLLGWSLNPLLTIFGISFFWLWGHFRKKDIISKKNAAKKTAASTAKTVRWVGNRISESEKIQNIKWVKRLKILRWIRAIVEFIPILNLLPLWSICAYFELKYS